MPTEMLPFVAVVCGAAQIRPVGRDTAGYDMRMCGFQSRSDAAPLLLQSLSFARAASVMRACAFKVQPNTDPATLKLPFIGPARAQQICDLATSGTTPELEEHRRVQRLSSPLSLLRPFQFSPQSAARSAMCYCHFTSQHLI